MYYHIQLVPGGWDLNSGPYTRKAGIFLTEPSQQPLTYFVSFFLIKHLFGTGCLLYTRHIKRSLKIKGRDLQRSLSG